ncbi:MAG: tRNA (N6-threonylcarbamoyladenosine(37)-N6)-methyltransferase TrmO [Mycobacteriales bacterium]
MDAADWDRRLAELWASVDERTGDDFVATMAGLVAELPPGDPVGFFERASAYDSTGDPERAVQDYRRALAAGLSGPWRRRAVIQLASSLRNLGQVEESVALLTAERDAGCDDLDDAVRAFLALALSSAGRDREAAAVALTALAPHLTRYTRSLVAYAEELGASAAGHLVRPVGRVESPLTDRDAAPNQGDEGAPDATIAFRPDLAEAYRDIGPGAELIVLTWLDRADRGVLSVHPRGDTSRPITGVFSTRSPDRPNPIGLHRVTVLAVDGARLRVAGLEALDGTPVLDVKPVLGAIAER